MRPAFGAPTHLYVQSATLNGQALSKLTFSHADLRRGGELRVVMEAP